MIEFNPDAIEAEGFVVDPSIRRIVTSSLRSGILGAEYADTIVAAEASASWSVVSGALPSGLALDGTTGVVSGVPSDAGAFTFRVRAQSQSLAGERVLTVTIGEPLVNASDVIDEILGVPLLSPGELRYLDLVGNANGEFDIGDVRAFLRRPGASANREVRRD